MAVTDTSDSSALIPESSEIAFSGRLIDVRVDALSTVDDRPSRRDIVVHPGSVGVLAVTIDDRVILVRQYRHATGTELLEIPAGLIDDGEPYETAARRELQEETGCAVGRLHPIGTYWLSPGYSMEQCHLFFAPECRCPDLGTAREPGVELVVIAMSTLSDILGSKRPLVADAKTMIALQWLLLQRTT